jgi:hypothetical protein
MPPYTLGSAIAQARPRKSRCEGVPLGEELKMEGHGQRTEDDSSDDDARADGAIARMSPFAPQPVIGSGSTPQYNLV